MERVQSSTHGQRLQKPGLRLARRPQPAPHGARGGHQAQHEPRPTTHPPPREEAHPAPGQHASLQTLASREEEGRRPAQRQGDQEGGEEGGCVETVVG